MKVTLKNQNSKINGKGIFPAGIKTGDLEKNIDTIECNNCIYGFSVINNNYY